jgi:hypothetical protein
MAMPDGKSGTRWTAAFEKLVTDLADSDGAVLGKMFGGPCGYIEGKGFTCLYQDNVVFKLSGDAHAAALKLAGAHLFDPSGMGRAMKEWVVVPNKHSARWPEIGKQALTYVAAAQKAKR